MTTRNTMKIYTGTASGTKLEKLISTGMGIMISPSPSYGVRREFSSTFCALDNGAFQAWMRGFPFMERHFWDTLNDCWEKGVKLDFIVIPDIVAGGRKSLDFSIDFRDKKLASSSNLALAVQDGIAPQDVDQYCLVGCSTIFVGGTLQWKWKTAGEWSKFAKVNHKRLHIARCGTKSALSRASLIGADSADSTSFSRNDSFEIVQAFRAQGELLGLEETEPPPCVENGVID